VGKLNRRGFLFLLVLLVLLFLERVIIVHGRTGLIQEIVAEGDDVRLVRLLAKSAEVLSIVGVQGDLVKVLDRSRVTIAMVDYEIVLVIRWISVFSHKMGQGVI
jgi:hypothetical protein